MSTEATYSTHDPPFDRYVIEAQPTKIDPLAYTRVLTTMSRGRISILISFGPLGQQTILK